MSIQDIAQHVTWLHYPTVFERRLPSRYSCSYHSPGVSDERQPPPLFCHTSGSEVTASERTERKCSSPAQHALDVDRGLDRQSEVPSARGRQESPDRR